MPAEADQDHIDRTAHRFNVEHVNCPEFGTAVYPTGPRASDNATDPAIMVLRAYLDTLRKIKN